MHKLRMQCHSSLVMMTEGGCVAAVGGSTEGALWWLLLGQRRAKSVATAADNHRGVVCGCSGGSTEGAS
jgi:hypothetical protein